VNLFLARPKIRSEVVMSRSCIDAVDFFGMTLDNLLEVIVFKTDTNEVSSKEFTILQDFTVFKHMSWFSAYLARGVDVESIRRCMHSIDCFGVAMT